jgi:hypothetical protein
MIRREFFRIREDGVVLYRTYSDANLYIRKVGTNEVYSDAVDVSNASYTYEETSKAIGEEEDWREATEAEKIGYEEEEPKKEESIIETPEDAEVIEEL